MERPAPHPQRTLSKQAELDEDEEIASVDPAKEKSNEAKPPPPPINNNNSIGLGHRSRSQSKVKLLVRSHAVCEETSPPPDLATPPPSPPLPPPPPPTNNDINNINSNNNASSNNNSLTVTRHKLRRDGSSQGSFESNSWSPSNSRGSSTEQYTDSTGVDLEQFIAETLNRNQKDRILLLKIEHDLVNLAKDTKRTVHKFPPMSSYQRMLVHRAAAYFGMEHNVDPGGHSVVVNTTKATRIPDSRFKQHLREDLLFPEEPRKSILKRDSASFEETGSFKSVENGDPRRSKSFEEREEEYEKVRRRIFNRNEESGSFEELGSYHDPSWASTESENLNPRQRTNCSERPSARLLKVESYESKDTLRANSLRQTVSKSYSFGGYDQSQPTTRILTKTDSGSSMSSRLSPSSSGYKSQSQRSDTTTTSATPSPTATPHPHLNQMSSQSGEGVLSPADVDQQEQESPTVVWAVTNMSAVPPGSVLINPQTGQPYTNADGSVYHFDPDNPPRVESIIVNPPALTNNNNDSNNVDNSANDTDNANHSCSSSDSAEIVQESAPSQTPTSPAHNPPPPPSSSTPPPPPPPAESSSSSASSSRSPSPSESAAHQECPPQEPAPPPPQEAPPQEKPPAPQPAPAVKPSPIKQQHSTPRQQDSISSTSHHASNAHPPHNNSSQNMNGFREADKYVHHPAPTTHYGHHGGPTSSPLSHHPHHYPMTPPGPMYPPYPPATYNLVLQPPCPENPYRPNQQPPALMYASPAQPVHHSYEHIPPDANDFSGYMLGLNVDGSRNTASHNTDNRTGPPVIYWPHPQMTQGQNKSVPVYYAPATSQVPSPRYNQSAPPPPPAYQHYPSERPGINPYSGSECNMTYPHTALHMYYSTQCNNGNAAPSQATASWNNGASSNNSAPLVTLQYPAAPTPPQNLCNLQYAMYNSNGVGYGMRLGGCYQYPGATGGSNPLGNPQPPLPLPQLYRPPNLQVGRGSGARGSPGMKDMNDYGAHLPVYGLRVMQGNANRLSFALSSNGVKPVPAHHMRKQRPNSGRPLLMTSQPPPPPNPQHHLGQTGYLMSTVAP